MLGQARRIAALGLLSLIPISAQANNFNYNMMEFRMGTSPATFGTELTTYFTENSHFIGRFDSEFSNDWDLAGGIGFNGPINQFGDVYGQMLLHSVKDSSDTTFKTEVNIGTRFWVLEGIEAHVKFGKIIDNDDTKSTFAFGARFYSTEQLALGAEMKNNGVYGHQMVMSVRFHY
ncbi:MULTISPECIES: hypothetical protein [Vibrio]|uniref:Outer membrane protein beta-barrel domain-containing protein n=2 Tax=Vibrio TaxID=662 RepID=A0A1E5CSZ2_9VIBR|nr:MULTISPECIES: hypothetical protein [Vibrio]MDN3695818.1 hypothetical protein [Vibrio cortegadensis]OEE72702.1 hypothetical protein A130_07250 [Vibrio genomosp. F6 str. FF-238]